MNREDFPMLFNNIIYFDNGATTFKPKQVLKKISDYYTEYTAAGITPGEVYTPYNRDGPMLSLSMVRKVTATGFPFGSNLLLFAFGMARKAILI